MEELEDTQKISMTLSRMLTWTGVSSFNTSLCKSQVHIMEIFQKYLYDYDIMATGSFAEGSQTEKSDLDQMWIMAETTVIGQNDLVPDQLKGNILTMETNGCRPGYSKLILTKIDESTRNAGFIKDWCEVVDQRNYLSSEKYTTFAVNLVSNSDNYSTMGTTDTSCFRHGPCATINYKTHKIESDIASAIKCLSWPPAAEEWMARRSGKTFPWPENSLISNLKTMPCYLLPIGDPESTASKLEWRFAFVPAERELVWSFNNTQLHTYVLLKMLKGRYLEPIAKDQLSSFHLKTAVFWISEANESQTWTCNNLVNCVRLCLEMIESSLEEFFLPHFFVKERNLLHSKFNSKEELVLVQRKIAEIKVNLIPCLMECFERRIGLINIGDNLKPWQDGYFQTFKNACNKCIASHKMDLNDLESKQTCQKTVDTYLFTLSLPTSVERLVNAAEAIDNLPKTMNQIVVEGVRNYVSLRAGSQILAEAMLTQDKEKRIEMISVANCCFDSGQNIDGLAGQLHLATFHLMCGSIDDALQILTKVSRKNVLHYFKSDKVSSGEIALVNTDTGNTVETNDKVKVMIHMMDEGGNITKEIKHTLPITIATTLCDVIFTSADLHAVPEAIKFECAVLGENMNWNFCSIHPSVYAKYLRFEIALKTSAVQERDLILEQLAQTVANVMFGAAFRDGALDKHRLLNILGYCYLKCNYIKVAMKYILGSLEVRPSNGNAAVYHLCIIILKILNFNSGGKIDTNN